MASVTAPRGIAIPEVRAPVIASHRAGHTAPGPGAPCLYVDSEGTMCDHYEGCACHTWAPNEKAAGITDILAHTYQPFLALKGRVKYLTYVPGSADWLTSTFATRKEDLPTV